MYCREPRPPESHVHPALPASRFDFRAQPFYRRRGRNGIERHIDERGHATGRGSASGCSKSFPLRAAWLVDMDVRIHQPREHGHLACLKNRTGSVLPVRLKRCDPAADDMDGSGHRARRGINLPAANDEFGGSQSRWRRLVVQAAVAPAGWWPRFCRSCPCLLRTGSWNPAQGRTRSLRSNAKCGRIRPSRRCPAV